MGEPSMATSQPVVSQQRLAELVLNFFQLTQCKVKDKLRAVPQLTVFYHPCGEGESPVHSASFRERARRTEDQLQDWGSVLYQAAWATARPKKRWPHGTQTVGPSAFLFISIPIPPAIAEMYNSCPMAKNTAWPPSPLVRADDKAEMAAFYGACCTI